jgi:anthranilate phosphoribosyltransferase
LKQRQFAFLFAPAYHPLLGRLREIRRRLGIPTIFNLLGPLLNPAQPPLQLLGVAREELLAPMAGALARRSTLRRAFVIHGKDAEGKGLDEASIEGPTTVLVVSEGRVAAPQVLVPRELGLTPPPRHALRVADRAEALTVARGLFGGASHVAFRPAVADAVALQAALGLHLHRGIGLDGLADSLREARAQIDGGFPLPFALPTEVRP